MDLLRDWYNIIARNNQLAMLLVLLGVGTAFVVATAEMLAPFYGAVTIAYVMDVAMRALQRRGMSRKGSLALVYGIFIAVILALFGLLPILGRQLAQFVGQFPQFIAKFQDIVHHLPERYPTLVTADQLDDGIDELRSEMLGMSQNLARYLRATVIGLVTALVYLIIVPVMIFFLLKDKDRIIAWLASFLPEHHELAAAVWRDVNRQLQSFVGGKVLQMLIVGVVSYIVFAIIQLNYAPLLAVIISVAVMIPYVGAAAATVPVAAVALLQWGCQSGCGHSGGRLSHHSRARRQCAGAAPVLRSRRHSSRGHHNRHPVFRRYLGRVGCVLRHPACRPGEGGDHGVARQGALHRTCLARLRRRSFSPG